MTKAPLFTQHFARFACDGDTIETACGPIRLVATIERDDNRESPDERQDGFWPSLDPNDAGYIGPKSRATLARHTARAQAVMDAWRNDEWWYVGVCVQAFIGATPLTDRYAHALWGVDCNHPDYPWKGKPRGWYPNHYLCAVANEQAGDCYAEAVERLGEIAEAAATID